MWKMVLAVAFAAAPLDASVAQADSHITEAHHRFSVAVEGSGPDVIMIPGLMSDRAVWDETVAAIGGGWRVHRIQVSGFAGEPIRGNAEGEILGPLVDELHAYIAREGLQRPAIVGHSMGGLVGLMLAERHPGSVGRLMIVDALPFYSLLFSPQATAEAVAPQAAAMRDALIAMDAGSLAAQQSATMARLVKSDSARPRLIAASLASDRSVAARAMFELMTTDMRPRLSHVTAPVTVAYATNDYAPAAAVEPLYRSAYAGLAGARFIEIPDSFHFVMADQPERFADALKAFLAGD